MYSRSKIIGLSIPIRGDCLIYSIIPILYYFCVAGEWHQYDDIIYAKSSHGMVEKVKNFIRNTKPDLLRGRYRAGHIMLETIWDILGEWSKLNVRNFFVQLQQFFTTYSNPYVYEEQPKAWYSLPYGEEQV